MIRDVASANQLTQASVMTCFRFIPLALALTAAGALIACSTAPAVPADSVASNSTAKADDMAKMDAQMKTMHDIHHKMMAAKTPEERSKLKAEHMQTMKDAMKMMDSMPSPDMANMDAHHKMMAKRMEMMQSMMNMMMDQMPAEPAH